MTPLPATCGLRTQRAYGVAKLERCGAPATLEARQRDYTDEPTGVVLDLCSNCALWLNPSGLSVPVLTLHGHDEARP